MIFPLFGPIGTPELLVILIIVLILFGASRLPEIGKGIGQAIKNFKKATSEPDEIDVTPKKNTIKDQKKEETEKKEGD
jgi:sec-independent protein translocase protein TatA